MSPDTRIVHKKAWTRESFVWWGYTIVLWGFHPMGVLSGVGFRPMGVLGGGSIVSGSFVGGGFVGGFFVMDPLYITEASRVVTHVGLQAASEATDWLTTYSMFI